VARPPATHLSTTNFPSTIPKTLLRPYDKTLPTFFAAEFPEFSTAGQIQPTQVAGPPATPFPHYWKMLFHRHMAPFLLGEFPNPSAEQHKSDNFNSDRHIPDTHAKWWYQNFHVQNISMYSLFRHLRQKLSKRRSSNQKYRISERMTIKEENRRVWKKANEKAKNGRLDEQQRIYDEIASLFKIERDKREQRHPQAPKRHPQGTPKAPQQPKGTPNAPKGTPNPQNRQNRRKTKPPTEKQN
jgi:hypothetical protein